MSCLCPPDCCSSEMEKDESYAWFLIKVLFLSFPTFSSSSFFFVKSLFKVLYGQWFVMGALALPIMARQAKNHQNNFFRRN